jgi:hypothetical protein
MTMRLYRIGDDLSRPLQSVVPRRRLERRISRVSGECVPSYTTSEITFPSGPCRRESVKAVELRGFEPLIFPCEGNVLPVSHYSPILNYLNISQSGKMIIHLSGCFLVRLYRCFERDIVVWPQSELHEFVGTVNPDVRAEAFAGFPILNALQEELEFLVVTPSKDGYLGLELSSLAGKRFKGNTNHVSPPVGNTGLEPVAFTMQVTLLPPELTSRERLSTLGIYFFGSGSGISVTTRSFAAYTLCASP